ncbi:hypothetical protein Agabi119p4_2522 [Agaricus bisporus var. burnettii]|uniref:Uncharacterized protein n=1 Tax=Agaricus bisporus var. burnettii TaxID=192524 RepID=A0A8H7F987_AGABI|nr:hypothetical protein Agabi119p4_2522 [Agaricus bisporus var. burnettii]
MTPNETNEENQALGQAKQSIPIQPDNDTHMGQPSPPRPSETSLAELNDPQPPPLHNLEETTENLFTLPPPNPMLADKIPPQKAKPKPGKNKNKPSIDRLPIGHPDRPPPTVPHQPFSFAPPPPPIHGGFPPQPAPITPAHIDNITRPTTTTTHPLMLQGHMSMPIMPRHPFPPSENGVVSRGTFKYTEYTHELPHLYPQLGCKNLLHHQPQQILHWESKKGNKVLVREFRAKYDTDVDARRSTRSKIEDTLINFLGDDATLVLSDPKVDSGPSRARIDPPWHTLVYDLSNENLEKLLAHPIIASPDCVIIITPFQQVIPTFVAGITNITCRGNSEESQRTVLEAVQRGLLSNTPLASDFDQIAGQGSYQKLIDGLTVYFMNTSDTRPNEGWWNVESTGMPRHITIDQYQTLTDRIKTLAFPTDDYGDGVAIKKTRECINCKCITHTVQRCPLYNMRGWLGPTKEVVEDKPRNVQDSYAPRGQSSRGGPQRGRGRGGHRSGNTDYRRPRGYSGRG